MNSGLTMNTTGSNPVIQLDGISKKFGRKLVLDGISLQVPAGCVFALLGENGAGKSTLIRGLMGYHRFNAGSIKVAGFDPIKQPMELRRRVAYVSDAPGLYEWMSVAEAGWYASGFYAEGYLQRYAELCEQFALSPDAKIQDLSKGMRAKTALALAVACNPDLLILDEPTSGLDPLVRRSFLESMIDRAADGQTVFLSSHQIHEVERVADYVAILHAGRLQVVATLEELKNDVSLVEFSMRDPLLALPTELESAKILHRRLEGRTLRMMIQKISGECRSALERDPNVFELKIVRPNLEELYIGFTQPVQTASNSNRNVSDVA